MPAEKDWPVTVDPDAQQQLSFLHTTVEALRVHGEMPLWNPYFGGGVPWAGFIYHPGLSPQTLVYWMLGPVQGQKWLVVLFLLMAAAGTFDVLRRALGCGGLSSWAGAALLLTSSWMPYRLADGNYDELALVLAPLALALQLRLWHGGRGGWLLPVVYCMAFAQAKYAPFVFLSANLLFALVCTPFRWREVVRRLLLVGSAFLTGLALSLPKILPLLELMRMDLVEQEGYGGGTFYRSFADFLYYLRGPDACLEALGVSALLLVFLPLALLWRRQATLAPALLFALTFWLCLGPNAWVPANVLLERLPVFGTMNNVVKYWNILLVLSLCLGAGLVLDEAQARISALGLRPWLLVSVVGGLAFVPAKRAAETYGTLFRVGSHDARPVDAFHQIAHEGLEGVVDRYRFGRPNQYRYVRDGIGVTSWYGNFVFPEHAVPAARVNEKGERTENPLYEGEVVTPPGISVVDVKRSFNRLQLHLKGTGRGEVVVNQNYHVN